MEKKLSLELFRFNVERDYLPYFAKIQIKVDEAKSLLWLLEIAQENVLDYSYDSYGFRINGVIVFDFGLSLGALIERFGLKWKIEPLNPALVIQDLVINKEPFLKKIEILKQFGLNQDEGFLTSFLPFAYASPLSLEYQEFVGEAFSLLAYQLYKENQNNEILDLITQESQNLFATLKIKNYIFPHNPQIDKELEQFKKIVFQKGQGKDIQRIKKEILSKIK